MVIAAVPYGLMTLVNALIVEDVYDAHPSASSLSYGLSISSFALVGAAAPFLWTSQGVGSLQRRDDGRFDSLLLFHRFT